jgi:4-carboxymuconolactone decarboxylase
MTMPRISPLAEEEWNEGQRKSLEPRYQQRYYNVLGTIGRHWDALRKFDVWTGHIMGPTNTLAPRYREMLILRIGWLCKAEYEWGQHVLFAKEAGLSDDEIEAVKNDDRHNPIWNPLENALLSAVDELHSDAFISDHTWKTLSLDLETRQIMDLVFTVGHYNLVSMAVKTFRVQLDDGVKGF